MAYTSVDLDEKMKDKGVANAVVLVGDERNEFHLQRVGGLIFHPQQVSRYGRVSFFGLEELFLVPLPQNPHM